MPRKAPGTALTPPGKGRTLVRKSVEVSKLPAFPAPVEIVREVKLSCTDVDGNNNKFYLMRLEKAADGQWRFWKNYGRMGAAGRIEVEGQSTSRAVAEAAFDKLYHDKTRQKKSGKAEYTEVKTVDAKGTDMVAASSSMIGLSRRTGFNPAHAAPYGKGGVIQGKQAVALGLKAPTAWHPSAQKFYNDLLHETTCLVETGMQSTGIQVNASGTVGLKTPLGLIGKVEIEAAKTILDDIAHAIIDKDSAAIKRLNNRFFRIIPMPIGGTHVKLADNLIDTLPKVQDKNALLDAAIDEIDQHALAQQQAGQPKTTVVQQFPLLLEVVTTAEKTELNKLLNAVKCSCYHHQSKLTATEAFRVTRPSEIAKFRKDLKPIKTLFHGTRRETAAGILSRGFLPTKAAAASGGSYSGSNYGDGVYFADNAHKSTGYTGYAGTGKRTMFVALVAMGNAQVHGGRAGYSGVTRGHKFDSIWAKQDGGLIHDEMIVPTPEQTAIAYIITV